MKIDILKDPPVDIFKNRRNFTIVFISLVSVACSGLLFGAYAIIAETNYFKQLETAALVFFVAPATFIAYFGEKLQAYKKLTPPERQDLADLGQKFPEIKAYCDLVAKSNRQPIRAEYEACQAWAEEVGRQDK